MVKKSKIKGVAVNVNGKTPIAAVVSGKGVADFKDQGTILTKDIDWSGYGVYWKISIPKEFI